VVRLGLAPEKLAYLRRNWVSALALVLPALRVARVGQLWRFARITRASRGLRLARVLGSVNRGLRTLRRTLRRRGFGYVVLATLLIDVVGAAAMYAFEQPFGGGPGLPDYPTALWWTTMLLTTVGSEYWPRTPEGRLLCVLLSVYAVAVFGYLAATLASFFVGRDAAQGNHPATSAVRDLRQEIAELRRELRQVG
jgi:voltage-gated potassium channel